MENVETHRLQTAFPVSSYIPQFDGLRGLSILAVFLAHSEFLKALPYAGFLEYGRLGVDLFFVLSGFLITGILLDSRQAPGYFRNFYARRALRIWPLYYIVLILIRVLAPKISDSLASQTAHVWPYFFLYVQNLFPRLPMPFGLEPTWSLAVEEQFYITWPVFLRVLRARTLTMLLGSFVLLSLVCRIISYERGAPLKVIHNFTLCRLDGLAFGGLAAIWLRSRACTLLQWRRRSWQFILIGLIGTLSARFLFHQQSTVISYTTIAIAFTGLLGMALVSDAKSSLLGRFLSNNLLRYVGRISYGLYLLHMPIFLLISDFANRHGLVSSSSVSRNALIGASQFFVAAIIASISWRYLETPILKLKSFFPSGSKMHWPSQNK